MTYIDRLARLRTLLAADSRDWLAQDCLREIDSSEIVLSSRVRLSAEHALDTYSNRWDIQRHVHQNKVVIGYERVVKQLQTVESVVLLDGITGRKASYTIFSIEPATLVGVLKSSNYNLEKLFRLRAGNSTSHGARFIQGAIVETW